MIINRLILDLLLIPSFFTYYKIKDYNIEFFVTTGSPYK
jgi:hypothetical protein